MHYYLIDRKTELLLRRWVILGVWFGYDKLSIVEFVEFFLKEEFPKFPKDAKWNGTGHVPAQELWSLPFEELCTTINSRRFCPRPYPGDDITNRNSFGSAINGISRFPNMIVKIRDCYASLNERNNFCNTKHKEFTF